MGSTGFLYAEVNINALYVAMAMVVRSALAFFFSPFIVFYLRSLLFALERYFIKACEIGAFERRDDNVPPLKLLYNIIHSWLLFFLLESPHWVRER